MTKKIKSKKPYDYKFEIGDRVKKLAGNEEGRIISIDPAHYFPYIVEWGDFYHRSRHSKNGLVFSIRSKFKVGDKVKYGADLFICHDYGVGQIVSNLNSETHTLAVFWSNVKKTLVHKENELDFLIEEEEPAEHTFDIMTEQYININKYVALNLLHKFRKGIPVYALTSQKEIEQSTLTGVDLNHSPTVTPFIVVPKDMPLNHSCRACKIMIKLPTQVTKSKYTYTDIVEFISNAEGII